MLLVHFPCLFPILHGQGAIVAIVGINTSVYTSSDTSDLLLMDKASGMPWISKFPSYLKKNGNREKFTKERGSCEKNKKKFKHIYAFVFLSEYSML